MPRRRRRHTSVARPLKAVKYSNETRSCQLKVEASGEISSVYVNVVDTASAYGVRKLKNFTVRLTGAYTTSQADTSYPAYFWALVFVPQGTSVGTMHIPTTTASVSLYEPNQNVIMAGVCSGSQTNNFKTRLARNLNSSDTIALVVAQSQTMTGAMIVLATVNYAICYS